MDKKNMKDFVDKVEAHTNETLEDVLLDEDAKNEHKKNYKYEDIVKNNAKTRMSKLAWFTSVFLILIIALTVVAMFFERNPQTIFTMTIDKFFESITKNISDNNYEISKGKVQAKFNITSNDENKELYNNLSKLNFNIDYSLDNANNLSYVKLLATDDSSDALKLNVYSNKNDVYIYSKDMYDKYIKLSSSTKVKSITSKDIKNVLTGLNQAFDKVATSEKINSNKNFLDIFNKTMKVYETSLIIDNHNYKRVSQTFINTLKSNDQFMVSISKIKNKDSNEIKKSLNNYEKKLNKFFKENEKTEVKLYTDKKENTFIKGEISGKLESFTLTNNKDNSDFVFSNSENKTVSGNVSIVTNDAKTKNDIKLTFKEEQDGKTLRDGNIELSFTNKKANSFEKVNVENSVKEEDLSELEKLNIYTKLISNDKLSGFLGLLK